MQNSQTLIQAKDYLSKAQYKNADNLLARWDLYNYSTPKVNIHKEALEALKLGGSEAILDVGCGDGSLLYSLSKEKSHEGKLVGLEINNKIFSKTQKLQKRDGLKPQLRFIVGSADKLPFSSKSFDVVLALFMLYHMSDIQKTLREFRRVLKDGGRLVVATSSSNNRPQHKIIKNAAGFLMGKKPASQFSTLFNLENCQEQLTSLFKVNQIVIYKGEIRLKDPSPYLNSLTSIRDLFHPKPTPTEWKNTLFHIKEGINREILEKNYFVDYLERGFLICSKD